jgi:hypothetical protein
VSHRRLFVQQAQHPSCAWSRAPALWARLSCRGMVWWIAMRRCCRAKVHARSRGWVHAGDEAEAVKDVLVHQEREKKTVITRFG